MHEQSETIQLPSGKWINIYGRKTAKAGQKLPLSDEYDSVEEAVAAAKERSRKHGEEEDKKKKKSVIREMLDESSPANDGQTD